MSLFLNRGSGVGIQPTAQAVGRLAKELQKPRQGRKRVWRGTANADMPIIAGIVAVNKRRG
jgi:hypothetical protein